MEDLLTFGTLITFVNLTFLEIVLGIDNILFINILSQKLPLELQVKARRLGLVIALGSRLLFLLGVKWIVDAQKPLFTLFNIDFNTRDLVLIAGGLFLMAKASEEIFKFVEGDDNPHQAKESKKLYGMGTFLVQVGLVDIVFSIDSVITAVGLSDQIPVMVLSIICAIIIMLAFAEAINRFITSNPAFKILALSFLIVLGVVLIADGFHSHVPRGYIYFSMAFSLGVEMLKMRMKKSRNIT